MAIAKEWDTLTSNHIAPSERIRYPQGCGNLFVNQPSISFNAEDADVLVKTRGSLLNGHSFRRRIESERSEPSDV